MSIISLSILLGLQFVSIAYGFGIQPRIINGIKGNNADFPFFAVVQEGEGDCGGVLISDRWIITAAHCLKDNIPIDIFLGARSGSNIHHLKVYPWEYHIHPQYDDDWVLNDIALIQLPEPIKPCKTVKPAKLPTTCDAQMGNENVIVAGMGLTQVDDDSYNDRIIRYAEFVTISSETCAEQFTGPFNSKSVICTKTINGTAFYTGDSGGPMLRRSDNAVIGVVSFTNLKRVRENMESVQVFTYIPYYYAWIKHVTGIDYSRSML